MRYWKYLTAAFNARLFGIFVPPNWIGLAAAALMGFVDVGFLIVGGGLELLYLLGLSTSDRFQKMVDSEELGEARQASEDKIKGMLKALPIELQKRYTTVATRCADIVTRSSGESFADVSQIADGLNRLLWIYVRLLKTAYQMQYVDNSDFTVKVKELKQQLDASISDDLRSSIQSTLDTLEARMNIRKEATDKLAFCKSELRRIEEEIERTREQAIVSTEPVAIAHQINAITSGLGNTTQWMKDQQNIFGSLSEELSDSGPILSLNR